MTAAMPGVRIEAYRPSARPAVCRLQRLLWRGGDEGNARYLRWKYHDNPYLDDRYLLLAWERDELVGMVGAFGACWEMPEGGTKMLPCIADTVVIPEYRGTSLFLTMLTELVDRLASDDVPVLLDFGDQPAGAAMLMRGWRAIGPWAVASFQSHARRPISDHAAMTDMAGTASGIPIRLVNQPDINAIASLNKSVPMDSRIRHCRDATFLRWRLANPLARHWALSAGAGGESGYLLGHRTVVDGLSGDTPTTILDCEATDDVVWADLVAAAIVVLPGRQIIMWARDLSSSRQALLSALGMSILVPTGRITADTHLPNLLVRTICGTPADQARFCMRESWDLRSVCGRSWR